jgi:hypothetical protein
MGLPLHLRLDPSHVDSFRLVSRDSSVDIATGYGLDGRGSIPGKSKIFVSTPQRLDRLWDPPSFLINGYRGLFPRG